MALTPTSSRAAAGIPATLFDAKGDLVAASAADTAARVAVGTNGRPLLADSAAAPGVAWLPLELDYVQIVADVSITQTAEASAATVVTANAVTFDGATIVLIEFFAQKISAPAAIGGQLVLNLWDGATDIGRIAQTQTPVAVSAGGVCHAARRLTPSAAAHTYSIRAWVTVALTGAVQAGAGGAGTSMPAFLRISRVAA